MDIVSELYTCYMGPTTIPNNEQKALIDDSTKIVTRKLTMDITKTNCPLRGPYTIKE